MGELGWQAWVTVGVVLVTLVALVREITRPDLIFVGSLGLLLLTGVLSPEQAFAGFANPAVLTIAALFVVAAGVQQTEALGFLDGVLFPRSRRLSLVLPRLMAPTAGLSAFLNNTPIVAMLIPRVQQWADRTGIPASKVLIPLSYAAILGGTITLIGTSTNLVVSGLLQAEGYDGLGLFDLTWIGLPATALVVVYFALVGHRLLPDRGGAEQVFKDGLDRCLFEFRVTDRSSLIGCTVEEAGLRNLGDAFLVHVRRGDRIIPVTPDETFRRGDVLLFTGTAQALDRLLERPGLERLVPPVQEHEYKTLPLFEAVVASTSNLVGKSLKEVAFRDHYGGVVLGIYRKDARVEGPLGRTPIQPGDLLIVEAGNGFDRRWNARRDEFYLVAPRREEGRKPQRGKAPLALAVLFGMVGVAALGWLPLATAALAAALAMILLRCLHGADAREAVNLQVLVVIAAALGIGKAVEVSGLAAALAGGIAVLAGSLGPLAVLLVLYVATNVLTEMVTNNAAAALMVPVATYTAQHLGIDPKALALVVAIAASASFITPIGYQTNLMVMAAGRYRFNDYLKAGLPVSLIVMGIALSVIYVLWIA